MRSKRLSRQLKKNFGSEDLVDQLGSIASLTASDIKEDTWETALQALRGLPTFCESVEQVYKESDELVERAQTSLATSSAELSAANGKLNRLNQTFDAMVNSLGQGFVLFGRDGICLPIYSKVCEVLLDAMPSGVNIMDILSVPPARRESFQDWINMIFDEVLDFDDLAAVGPKKFEHKTHPEWHISLEFKPVRNSAGAVDLILMIATDRSDEVAAKKRAEESASFANMVIMLMKDRSQFRRFLDDGRQLIGEIVDLIQSPMGEKEKLDLICQKLHTLKGIAGIISASHLKETIHKFEEKLRDEHDDSTKSKLLGENVALVESEFELVLARIRDLVAGEANNTREVSMQSLNAFGDMLASGKYTPAQLAQFYQQRIMLTPIEEIFSPFNEVIAQTATRLNKRVDVINFGGDSVSLMREQHEAVWSSLTNVFRNIVDHGIEEPTVRTQKGKAETGKVLVLVRKIEGQPKPAIEIKISDDGAGINVEALKKKLEEAGRAEFAAKASNQELMNTIFEQGVSTAAKVTDISGMGVGLSSVREAVQKCGGNINVESQPGKGTTFILTLPISA